MLSKKNITRLLYPAKRRAEIEKCHPAKRRALMSAEYARYVVDGQILHRDASLENDKNSSYGFSPINFLCAVTKDGTVKSRIFEFNIVNHFLHLKEGENACEVVEAILLMWKAEDRMRYTVYAIPAELTATDVEKSTTGGILADYLLGMTYTNSFEIPAEYAEGYQFAVCILDRYGNEFQPMYIDIANAIDVIGEDAVTIEFDGWQLTTTKPVERLQIFNAMGQMMQEATDTDAIDVSGMPTGIYIVKALTGRQTAVKKIYIR